MTLKILNAGLIVVLLTWLFAVIGLIFSLPTSLIPIVYVGLAVGFVLFLVGVVRILLDT